MLRDLDRAKVFPQEPKGPGRTEVSACEQCGRPLRKVVFTTAGGGEQLEIWRAYPLAVDGWLCAGCGTAAMPRFISVEESVEFGQAGAHHASKGQFDDAEFWFRRILGSWPGYAGGYADMGQLSIARAEASHDLDGKQHHRAEAERWLRRAVQADPDRRLARVHVVLARMLALNGNEHEALEVLDRLLGDQALPEPLRTEAETLAADIRDGRALFSRAADMAEAFVLEPRSRPLTAAARKTLEAARGLLREAAERKRGFATSWFLGKVELRLDNLEAALAALQEAHALDPDQPDGCRELCGLYLELERAGEALPVARRAAELRPEDVGLNANLALVLLLTGDVDGAHAQASAALARDPDDGITRGLLTLIEDVRAGRRRRPRSLAEAEGRAKATR